MIGTTAESPAKDPSETLSGYWQLNATAIRPKVKGVGLFAISYRTDAPLDLMRFTCSIHLCLKVGKGFSNACPINDKRSQMTDCILHVEVPHVLIGPWAGVLSQ